MNKAYDKVTWVNKPSTASPLSQTNLNKMSDALDIIDDRVIALDSGKVSSVTVTNTLATGDTIATITVDGTSTNIKSAQITVDSEISTTSTNPVQNKVIAEALREVMPEVTVEGNPISITDGSNIVPAKLAEVTFLPKQNLHGYDSPWVGGAGKNKVPISDWFTAGETKVQDGITLTFLANGKIGISGTNTSSSATMLYLSNAGSNPPYHVWTVPSGQYTLSWNGIANTNVNLITSGGGNNGFEYTSLSSSSKTKTSTVSDGTKPFSYLAIQVGAGVQIPSNSVLEIQLEQGATATAWAPYENECPISGWTEVNLYVDEEQTATPETTYTESLGATYYGGKADFVSGKLTIDKQIIDLGTCTWNRNAQYNVMYSYISGKKMGRTNIISSQYKTIDTAFQQLLDGECSGTTSDTGFNIKDDRYTDADVFKTAMSGVQACFELATPIELTLTPQEIELLKGQNVLWSDSNGNIKLTYSADIAQYIANQLNS